MNRLFGLVVITCLGATPAVAQTTSETPTSPPQNQETPAKDTAPQHGSTSWKTLLKDSAQDFVAFPKRKSTWTFLAIGSAAALAAHPADDYIERHIVGNTTAEHVFVLGKWVGSAEAQIGAAVGLWAVGRYVVAPEEGEPRTNRYSEIGFDLIRAQILSQGLVHGIKYTVRRDRPTGECCAFPSGHAATAFAAASVLERHLGYRGSWPVLVGATYVATSRLVDNRHFFSDVVFGAALGTASGWTVVGTRGHHRLAMQPVPVPGGMMIAFTRADDHGDRY